MRESSQTQLNQNRWYILPYKYFHLYITLIKKIYEQTGVVTEISLSAHPHAAYISLTLKYFEENLMMATSGRNM
jgi:hypothetical protein